MYACVGHVQLFATPWPVACQAPMSMEFSRQEYCSGLPFPPPGDLPQPRDRPMSLALAGGFFTTSTTWEALNKSDQPGKTTQVFPRNKRGNT